MITFQATPYKINSWLVVRLPQEASDQLPSRGQVMVKGSINGVDFQDGIEPDGNGGHWINITKNIQEAGVSEGSEVEVSLEATKDWPEPVIPKDVMTAIKADPKVHALWDKITPMARWEWLRWIGSTSVNETRQRRIEVSCSKMLHGERRPCCFNRNMCMVPDVAKNGVLIG